MFCKSCNVMMTHVRRFSTDGNFELHVCPRCHTESKARPIILGKESEYQKYNKDKVKSDKNKTNIAKKDSIISKKHTTTKKKK